MKHGTEIVMIGAGNFGVTAQLILAETLLLKAGQVIMIHQPEEKQSPFRSEPIPIVAIERSEYHPIFLKEPKPHQQNRFQKKNWKKKRRR